MTRAVLAPALAVSLIASPLAAQNAPTLWDLFKPELLIQRALQSGIMAARTQVDIQYGDMVVSPVSGQVAITDLQIWPLPEWDQDLSCVITVDRAVLRSAAVDEAGRIRLKVQLTNAEVNPSCLPPDAQGGFQMTGLQTIAVPRATLDIDYDVPSAGADVHLYALVSDFAAVDVTADFSYLWVDGRDDMDEPTPVIFLSHASATLENLGGYQAMQGLIPPPFTQPQAAPGIISSLLSDALNGMNAEAAQQSDQSTDGATNNTENGTSNFDNGGSFNAGPVALTDAQQTLISSLEQTVGAFLTNPTKIVVETGFNRDEPAFVDVLRYEREPLAMIEDLQPRFGGTTVFTREMLPVALLSQALGEAAASLAPADQLAAGTALVSGVGAPRNIEAGLTLLGGLAEAGNSEAAIALATAMVGRDSEEAYRWALRAGGAGATGAASLLDRIETTLPFPRVLEIQGEVLGAATYSLDTLAEIGTLRREAALRMTGIGASRNYQTAALWAMIASAAGDPEASGILDDIDDIVRMAGPDARDAWGEQEKISADLALQVWIGQDLPTRYTAQ